MGHRHSDSEKERMTRCAARPDQVGPDDGFAVARRQGMHGAQHECDDERQQRDVRRHMRRRDQADEILGLPLQPQSLTVPRGVLRAQRGSARRRPRTRWQNLGAGRS